ncbi:MAG: hypothetical protein R3D58_13570 [Saprospiraceae bacterium]
MNTKFNSSLLIGFLLLGANLSVSAQTYTVVKPKGKITLKSGKRQLRTGDTFKAGPLKFSTPKDFLVVLDETAATFLLYPADSSLKKYVVKPLPPVGLKPGDIILTDLQLREFLKENDSLLLLNGTYSLILGKTEFPMNKDSFFYMKYIWKGDTVLKKLDYREDTLIINSETLYQVYEHPIDPLEVSAQYYLRYYTAAKKESVAYPEKMRPIYIIRPDETALAEEVNILLQATKAQPMKVRTLVVRSYLSAFYGMPGDWELDQLIKKLSRR